MLSTLELQWWCTCVYSPARKSIRKKKHFCCKKNGQSNCLNELQIPSLIIIMFNFLVPYFLHSQDNSWSPTFPNWSTKGNRNKFSCFYATRVNQPPANWTIQSQRPRERKKSNLKKKRNVKEMLVCFYTIWGIDTITSILVLRQSNQSSSKPIFKKISIPKSGWPFFSSCFQLPISQSVRESASNTKRIQNKGYWWNI